MSAFYASKFYQHFGGKKWPTRESCRVNKFVRKLNSELNTRRISTSTCCHGVFFQRWRLKMKSFLAWKGFSMKSLRKSSRCSVLISNFHCNYLTTAWKNQPLDCPRDISIKLLMWGLDNERTSFRIGIINLVAKGYHLHYMSFSASYQRFHVTHRHHIMEVV